ncbi:ABC transporter ATP-binding protein [Desulfuromonas thiophila]|uniref:ABC transporter ATP-binding protein n=1 Tax=Desulfuromonas thiophila TaxID=57664 RepID=UPI0024A85B85|nr:ABC transporter ATP-binding protein [Desulfuromonas thiophila]
MDLTLRQLRFAYRGGRPVLNGLDTTLADGQLTALLGVNGSGKSTLLKLMAGILTPNSGTIVLGAPLEQSLSQLGPRRIAQYCAYVAQNTQPATLTVFDYVLLGRLPHQHGWSARASVADLNQVEACLNQMDLTDLAGTHLNQLSGGQVQMAVIARALAQQPVILLLDEPTNNLDPKHQVQLMDKLRTVSREQGTMVIFSMHDINLALQWADRVMLLHQGGLLRHDPTQLLTTADLSTLFGMPYQMVETRNHQHWFWPALNGSLK